MEKVLLDTDIGTDIDDAVCLAYLLSNPNCDLLGITTVTGEPDLRARMASALCLAAGREDIPIYPGAAQPILVDQGQPQAQQAEVLGNWPHRTAFPKGEAVDFLRRTIRAHPGEVTLLTIGPLTNIGLLFRVDPEIPALLKRLVMMCGLFTNRVPGFGPTEWNAMGDPHASAVAYRSPVPVHRSIGLDVTTQVVMSAEEARRRFTAPSASSGDEGRLAAPSASSGGGTSFRGRLAAPVFGPVLDFAEVWFRQWGGIMFHDPLAATTIFNDQICQFERGLVEIELESRQLAGFTRWTPQANGPHEAAFKVDPAKFFEEYFSVF